MPKEDKDIQEVAVSKLGIKEIRDRMAELHEENPMLGHRGCRLGISFPEIYEMQCKAIFEAIIELKKEKEKSAIVEIMIPLVSTDTELKILRNIVDKIAEEKEKENKIKLNYIVGTMIELQGQYWKQNRYPNMLIFLVLEQMISQTTLGISRDDSVNF